MNPIARPALFLLTVLAASSADAQFNLPPSATDGIVANAKVEIETRPQSFVMTIAIEGRSSDLPAAAAELKKRIESAREKLKTLSAEENSITVAKPQLQGSGSPQQAQQMQMMMQQYGGGARGREMLESTKSVSILQTITARWPIQGDDDLDRLIHAHELTEKIKAADVASSQSDQPVSDAQQELAVEMTAMMDEYSSYGEEQTKTGEPTFTYLATITKKQYEDAILSAFQKARSEIESLGKLSGIEVEGAKLLSASVSVGDADPYAGYGRSGQPQVQQDEATGDRQWTVTDPNQATCTVNVTAIGKYVR